MTRIAALTHGGDVPGLNAAIKGIVYKAVEYGLEVIGIKKGYEGILEKKIKLLKPETVKTWSWYGGTRLGASRLNPFDVGEEHKDKSGDVLKNLEELEIDYLIVMGGGGSLRLTYELSQKGLKVVGIPKTIDKDVLGTDYTLGFDSAVNSSMESIGQLINTTKSHNAIHVVELMGRDAGHLALHSGFAAGADIILIPEYRFGLEQLVERVKEKSDDGKKYCIIVYSENAKPADEKELEYFCDKELREFVGRGAFLSAKLKKWTRYKIRYDRLGHTQRGAIPTRHDVEIGKKFGAAAVELVMDKKFGQMVSLENGRITSTSLEEVTKGLNLVNIPEEYDVKVLNAAIGGLGSRI